MELIGLNIGPLVNSSLELALRVIPPFKKAKSSVIFRFKKSSSGNLERLLNMQSVHFECPLSDFFVSCLGESGLVNGELSALLHAFCKCG